MSIPQELIDRVSITPQQLTHLQNLAAHSPYMMRMLSNNQALLEDLLENSDVSYDLDSMQHFLDQHEINSEEILKLIPSERNYEIFLEALFRRMSLSQTHLSVLEERYH